MSEMKDRLKELRKALNLKQREVAEKLGVRVGDVGGWESGRHVPDSRLRLLCHEYNVRREWLETGEGEMFEPEKDARELKDFSDDELWVETMKRMFARLDPNEQNEFIRYCNELLEEQEHAPQPPNDDTRDFPENYYRSVADAQGTDSGNYFA